MKTTTEKNVVTLHQRLHKSYIKAALLERDWCTLFWNLFKWITKRWQVVTFSNRNTTFY